MCCCCCQLLLQSCCCCGADAGNAHCSPHHATLVGSTTVAPTSHRHHRLWAPEPLEHLAILLAPHLPGLKQEVVMCCNLKGVAR
jgi:hypothetical protein